MPHTPPPSDLAGSSALPPLAEKARWVRAGFAQLAPRYDLFNDLVTQGQHRLWKRALLREAGVRPGLRVLDLCCGTGDLALRSRLRLGPQDLLLACDFCLPMLRQGKARLLRQTQGSTARPTAHWVLADALKLPFAQHSWDVITIGYGLRNVARLQDALIELHRVLKPGGVLALLDTGHVRSRWMRPWIQCYFRHIAPRIGALLQRNQAMFAYLPASAEQHPSAEALQTMLEQNGFAQVRIREFLWGITVIHIAHAKT